MRLILFELRPLIGIGNVLQKQRMQVKLRAECAEHLHIVDPADIHPQHRLIGGRMQLVHGEDTALLAARTGVVEERDGDRPGLLLADMHQRSRRQTGLFGSLVYEFHGSLLVRSCGHQVKQGFAARLSFRRMP